MEGHQDQVGRVVVVGAQVGAVEAASLVAEEVLVVEEAAVVGKSFRFFS